MIFLLLSMIIIKERESLCLSHLFVRCYSSNRIGISIDSISEMSYFRRESKLNKTFQTSFISKTRRSAGQSLRSEFFISCEVNLIAQRNKLFLLRD